MIQDFFQLLPAYTPALREISAFIHQHPEIGYQEFLASQRVADFLSSCGFQVEHPAYGLETAVCARFQTDAKAPCVCVCGEYDALPGVGHACGHNLIATAGLAAAVTAAEYARTKGIPLNLVFLGTPAEESGSGKGKLIEAGAFRQVEMAIMAHGGAYTESDEGALGVDRAFVRFYGRASHAGAAPEKGLNALDAMVYFYSDMLEWKKTILPRERVHGCILDGGKAANIIPDFTEAHFYVRSPEVEHLKGLKEKLEHSVQLGAQKTGCRGEVVWNNMDMPIKINNPLNDRYVEIWKEAGQRIRRLTGTEGLASTDMGSVTQVIPGAQFRFSITGEKPAELHSVEFLQAAATEEGFQMAIQAGAVMGNILVDYSTKPEFRQAVKQDFLNA